MLYTNYLYDYLIRHNVYWPFILDFVLVMITLRNLNIIFTVRGRIF